MAPKKPQGRKAAKVNDLKPKATQDVQGGNRSKKAQSDVSSKWSSTLDGIAQNFK